MENIIILKKGSDTFIDKLNECIVKDINITENKRFPFFFSLLLLHKES